MKIRSYVRKGGHFFATREKLSWPSVAINLTETELPVNDGLEWVKWLKCHCPHNEWHWCYDAVSSSHLTCLVYIRNRHIAAWFKLIHGSTTLGSSDNDGI